MKQEWMNRPVSSMRLEQYALGELTEAETRQLEERLASDPSLKRRLEAIEAHNALFEAGFPAAEMLPRIEAAANADHLRRSEAGAPSNAVVRKNGVARAGKSPGTFHPRNAGAMAGAAARAVARVVAGVLAGARARPMAAGMALVTLIALLSVTFHVPLNMPPDAPTGNPAGQDGVRLKGQEPELLLYRNTPQGPERVRPGATAAAGEVYQAEFHPGDFAYGAIASVDGNGSVTLHWPPRADAGTSWSALPGHRLPKAYQLDAAPGFERFHLLLSRKPLALDALLPLVAASARRDEAWLAKALPDPVHVVTISLRKER